MKRFYSSKLKIISLITVVSVTFLFSFGQTGWGAVTVIQCPTTTQTCNGTAGDDMIFGAGNIISIIHGLEGNDYIISSATSANNADIVWGDDGNDTLVGTFFNDTLNGGSGNDKYDGYFGNDTIIEYITAQGLLVSNNDVISGGQGNDFIDSGHGSDRINTGQGNDFIRPNGSWRDFSIDTVNCGSGTDIVQNTHSADDTAVNCESVGDNDG
jgi:Ca2+-binding RTX toxin-like protein